MVAAAAPASLASDRPILSDASAEARPFSDVDLRTFVRENHAFAWRMLRRLGVQEAAVDDAVQQVFMVVVQRLAGVSAGKERAFLVSVIMRVAANARRTLARTREHPWNDDPPDVPSETPTPEEQLSQAERRALLDAVLDPLSDELRTVFVLAELEEMSAPEIASLVGVPVGTVTSRLRRARELVERQVRLVRARHSSKGAER